MRSRKHIRTRLWRGAIVAPVLLAGTLSAADVAPTPQAAVIARERYAMGTVFRVVARAEAEAPARVADAIEAGLDAVSNLDHVLSHYDPDSELSRLSGQRPGTVVAVSTDLYDALERSLAVTRLSGGRFDVTVGPLVRLWRAAHVSGRQPSAVDMEAAAACVGPDAFVLMPPASVRVASSCLALDLGGIGKGLAVDRVVAVLRAHGIRDAIVNGGGSTLRAIGSAADGPGWPVHTPATGEMRLTDASLSVSETSGELVDPHRWAPAVGARSVTVLTSDAATADALSTALLLSTIEDGRRMLRQVPDAAVWWTNRGGHVIARHPAAADDARSVGATR